MLNHIFIYIFLVFFAIIISSCGDVEKPISEVPPDTYVISGPEDGAVVPESSVTFIYQGNNDLIQEFSYVCTSIQDVWSAWSADRSITLGYLDQGDYVFQVKGRYEPGNEDQEPARRAFTIDIPGPAMLLKPLKKVAVLGQEFKTEVIADEVKDLMVAHLILKFDPSQLQVLDAIPGEVFNGSSLPKFFFKVLDNTSGIVDINMSTIGAKPDRISGTEIIAAVKFKPLLVGKSNLDINIKSEFRDLTNRPLDIINRIGSVIEILESSR